MSNGLEFADNTNDRHLMEGNSKKKKRPLGARGAQGEATLIKGAPR